MILSRLEVIGDELNVVRVDAEVGRRVEREAECQQTGRDDHHVGAA